MGPLTYRRVKNKTFSLHKVYYAFLTLMIVFFIGVTGYMVIESFSFVDAFYMTVITVSTVGFMEIHELSMEGRLFTIILIILSFSTFAYALTAITTHVVDGEFQRYYRELRVNKSIRNLENHVIVCGFGRNGSRAALELKQHNKDFVVIESDPDMVHEIRSEHNYLCVEGDALNDKVLLKADINAASAIITTLPEDSDNVYVVLTARSLNPNIFIVSRASSDGSDSKLYMAGANNVIMPDRIGGTYMASMVVQPDVIEFVNSIVTPGADPSNIEEISCANLPKHLKSSTIGELKSKITNGSMVLGMKTEEGNYSVNPSNTTTLEDAFKIFVIGTKEQRKEFDA